MKYIALGLLFVVLVFGISTQKPDLRVFVEAMEKKAADLAGDIKQMSADLKDHDKADALLPEMQKMQDTMDQVQVIIDKVHKDIIPDVT